METKINFSVFYDLRVFMKSLDLFVKGSRKTPLTEKISKKVEDIAQLLLKFKSFYISFKGILKFQNESGFVVILERFINYILLRFCEFYLKIFISFH